MKKIRIKITELIISVSLISQLAVKFFGLFSFQVLPFIALMTPVLLWLNTTLNTRQIFSLFVFLFLCIFPVYVHFLVFDDHTYKYLLHFGAAGFAAFFLSQSFQHLNWERIFYVTSFFIVCLIIYQGNGGHNDYINRTYYVTLVLPIYLILNFISFKRDRKITFLPTFVLTVIAAISLNRGTLLPLLVLNFLFILVFLRGTRLLVFGFFSLIFIAFFFDMISDSFYQIEIIQRIQDRGLSSGRFEIWGDFFRNHSIEQLWLLGGNADTIMMQIGRWHFDQDSYYSLHSVPLQMLIIGGIFPTVFYLLVFYRLFLFSISSSLSQTILMSSITSIIFLKSLVEVSLFPHFTDVLYLMIFFVTVGNQNWRNEREKSSLP